MLIPSVIKKNLENLFSLGATVARASSRFLLVFLASFILSKYEFGLFNIFLSIYFFSRLFSENSLNLPFIKYATDGKHDPALVNYQIVILKVVYVVGVSLVLFACADLIVKYSGLERKNLLYLVPCTLIALTSYMFVGQLLIAQIRMRQLFFYELMNCFVFILLVGGAYFSIDDFNTEKLVLVFLVSMIIAAVVGIISFRRYISFLKNVDRKLILKIINYSKYTLLSGLSIVVILRADVLMLGYFLGPRAVAVYGMALFVNEAVNIIFDSVLRICLPKASSLSGNGDVQEIKALFRDSVKTIYLGIIPIIIVIGIGAPPVINFIYGGKYDDSIALVYLFLASSFIKPIGSVAGNILGATGNIRYDNMNCWISALLNVVCNYFLIPLYGVMGAAVASILSFTALTILHYAALKRVVFNERKKQVT